MQHLAWTTIEAELLAAGLVFGIKETVRRDRPAHAETRNATGFSFPSGHAASTFAAATVLQQHLGYKAGIPTYLVASYVAMSRLHENVHFASDVVFGATIGIVVGRTVTWHGRNFYASPMLLPKGGGIIVNVHVGLRACIPSLTSISAATAASIRSRCSPRSSTAARPSSSFATRTPRAARAWRSPTPPCARRTPPARG